MATEQNNPHGLWLPKIDDWAKVEIEAYKLILAEAKERFSELKGNSEDLTERAQKLVVVIASVMAAFLGSSIKIVIPGTTIVMAVLLYVLDLVAIFGLLSKKALAARGISPSESFPDRLDDGKLYKTEEQEKLVYYRSIVNYEGKIRQVKALNNERTNRYQFALIYTLILITATILYVVYSISPFHLSL